MTLAENIARFVELWRRTLPHVRPPSVQDAAHWGSYQPEIVERAISRAGRRFAPGKVEAGFTPDEAYRYTSRINTLLQLVKPEN